MKRRLLLIGLLAFLFQSCILYFFRDTDLGGWEFVGPETLEYTEASGVELVEVENNIVVVYPALVDPDSMLSGEQVHFSTFDGRRWLEFAPAQSLTGTYNPIRAGVLDSGNLCYVAGGFEARISVWDGVEWSLIPGPAGTEEYRFKSAAFTPGGTLYLALADGLNDNRLYLYAYLAGAWSQVGDPAGLPEADDLWMETDAGGCVVYHSVIDENLVSVLTLYRENGLMWETFPAPPVWAEPASQLSSKRPLVTSADTLYCAVFDPREEPAIPVLLEHSAGEWVTVGGPTGGSGSLVFELTLAANGEAIVLVDDRTAYGELSAYRVPAENWERLGIPGFSFGDAPGESALLSATDGYLYVAFVALGHDRAVSVMRYPFSL